jgi:type II secretory pathway pseudopilin PulG
MALSPLQSRKGCTLIEAMILLVILGIVSVGAGVALQGLTQNPSSNDFQLAVNNAIVSKMEYVLELNYELLPVGTALSDSVSINGVRYARTVTIVTADPNDPGPPIPPPGPPGPGPGPGPGPRGPGPPPPPPAPPPDLVQVTVSVNGQSLTTLEAQP